MQKNVIAWIVYSSTVYANYPGNYIFVLLNSFYIIFYLYNST